MTFDAAVRATQIIMALTFIQQSAEHLIGTAQERRIYGLRILLCILVVVGLHVPLAMTGLAVISLWMLQRYQGPYNGGSDRMSLLILWSMAAVAIIPSALWQERVFGYLAMQVTLSYFISGWVKFRNPDWRSGRALSDVFAFSTYPVSEDLRGLATKRVILTITSWAVIGFEVLFPVSFVSATALLVALSIGAAFHLANAVLFGLNRFFWIWLAAYPSLIWLQVRLFSLT